MSFVEESISLQDDNYHRLTSVVASEKEKLFTQKKNISVVPDQTEEECEKLIRERIGDIVKNCPPIKGRVTKTTLAGEILRTMLKHNNGVIPYHHFPIYKDLCDLAGVRSLADKFVGCLDISPLYNRETGRLDVNIDSLESVHNWYVKTRSDHKKVLDQRKYGRNKELAREDINSIPDLYDSGEDTEQTVDLSFLGKASIEPIRVQDPQIMSFETRIISPGNGKKSRETLVSFEAINIINEKIYEIRSVVDTIKKEVGKLVTLTDGVKSFCKSLK